MKCQGTNLFYKIAWLNVINWWNWTKRCGHSGNSGSIKQYRSFPRSNRCRSNTNTSTTTNGSAICRDSSGDSERRDHGILVVTILLPVVVLEKVFLGNWSQIFYMFRSHSGRIWPFPYRISLFYSETSHSRLTGSRKIMSAYQICIKYIPTVVKTNEKNIYLSRFKIKVFKFLHSENKHTGELFSSTTQMIWKINSENSKYKVWEILWNNFIMSCL